jgi:3-oxoacyl-[acyl-carrier protein] reductase
MSGTGPGRGVAVVSGGSRGLGRALVERLLDEGWRVATFSRNRNDFVEQTLANRPDDFFWAPADLGEPETVREFSRAAEERFGGIDLLVNNAATLHRDLFLTVPPKEIDRHIVTNLVAPMALTQACARAMTRRGGGQIITISSINSIRGYRGVSVYTAAKAGLDGFGRGLARELGPLGIRVNSVVPGFFDSELTAGVTPENRDRITRRTPLGRLGTVQDVLEAVLYLVSPAASFITGQSLVIDGGITC